MSDLSYIEPREPDAIRYQDGEGTVVRNDVVGTHARRWVATDEPSNWTAVAAGHFPLPPSPLADPFDLGPEFPTIRIVESELQPDVDERAWFSRAFDFWTFDRSMDARSGIGFYLTIRTTDPDATLPKVLTRCQRLFDRRNEASGTPVFDRILKAHRAIHELERPLVRADYDHALDVWQWVLRLNPRAGLEPQVAALFHDVDRLVGDSGSRVEQDRAEAGAWIAAQILGAVALPRETAERICALIEGHETPGNDAAATLIDEADALSFFSFNSPGFFDYFDAAHCRRKVDDTLARLGPHGRSLLRTIFLRPDVEASVRDAQR
jgi:hypothetical protein